MVYDVIVIGLGAMGSAAVYHLAQRGVRVLGIDRHTPPHDFGSSHGKSRVIRQAYMEGESYVPLVLRAYELWRDLERASGAELLTETGGLMIGAPDSTAICGSSASARAHGLDHTILDAAQIRRQFPPLHVPDGFMALYERAAGFLRPEQCVRAHLDLARRHGAALHFGEPVLRYEAAAGGEGVRVVAPRGVYEAGRLIIAPGVWATELLAELALPLQIVRHTLFWFDPIGGEAPFAADRFPIYIWEVDAATAFYGFPAQPGAPGGVKVAFHTGGTPEDSPDETDETAVAAEADAMRAVLRARIPALGGRLRAAVTCRYTMTPDEHFIIGPHPQHAQVLIASPCSGHGFKFSAAIGEALADLAQGIPPRCDLTMFGVGRFGPAKEQQ